MDDYDVKVYLVSYLNKTSNPLVSIHPSTWLIFNNFMPHNRLMLLNSSPLIIIISLFLCACAFNHFIMHFNNILFHLACLDEFYDDDCYFCWHYLHSWWWLFVWFFGCQTLRSFFIFAVGWVLRASWGGFFCCDFVGRFEDFCLNLESNKNTPCNPQNPLNYSNFSHKKKKK